MENFNFYKFTIYNYNLDANESFFIPVAVDVVIDKFVASDIVDCYLSDVCFCDSYEYKAFKPATTKQAKKLDNMLYNLYEVALYHSDFSEENLIKDNIVDYTKNVYVGGNLLFHLNSIYFS